ncbi:major facilitator superfamily domain-containing protein [Fusarium avenaceum]|nr:major facilitator superfamily domain-containing protein [Fusarium avenaceum]
MESPSPELGSPALKGQALAHAAIFEFPPSSNDRTDTIPQSWSRLRRTITVVQLCGVNFTSSATNGLIVIGLPRLTADLNIPPSLAFWPLSVQGLSTASTLLVLGAVADVVGPRSLNLAGCIANGLLMLSCGFIKNGEELIIIRALQGIMVALHLSTSVALVGKAHPSGRSRNVSFACLGVSQLIGFSFGLVVSGALMDTLGWRSGWYLYGGITLLLFPVGIWSLPRSTSLGGFRNTITNLRLLNSLDLLSSLFFQKIQHLSAIEAATRILPSIVVGIILNVITGHIVHILPAVWLVTTASLLSSGSPLIMALTQPMSSYWLGPFFAQLLLPFSIDVLFTVGLLIISEGFPEDRQSFAGALFNTAAQLGNALGLAIVQVVSAAVTKRTAAPDSTDAILEGYRACFWFDFALMLVCVVVGGFGMQRAGKIGLKHLNLISRSGGTILVV